MRLTHRPRHHLAQRLFQLLPKQGEVALYTFGAPDQHMIRPGHAKRWQQFARQNAKAALHPVADDSAANLFRDRDAVPHRRIAVAAFAHQQDKARHGRTPSAIRRQKIGALAHDGRRAIKRRVVQALRLLRPRARRARSTLRPPGVAMRARKP